MIARERRNELVADALGTESECYSSDRDFLTFWRSGFVTANSFVLS